MIFHTSRRWNLWPLYNKDIIAFLKLTPMTFRNQEVCLFWLTWMDDHVAMQVVWEVKLFSTAGMGANLGPSFPVHEVDVILQAVWIGRFNFISISGRVKYNSKKKTAVYLKAADGYIDLTAALIRTVKHFEHPVCLNNRASPVSLGPNVHNKKENQSWNGSLLLGASSSSQCVPVR